MKPIVRMGSVLLTALAIGASACTNVLGVTDLPSNACGGATFTTECEVCLAALCCPEEIACAQDSHCTGSSGLYDCALACNGAQDCLNTCGQGYEPAVVSEANALLTCQTQCNSACGGASTGVKRQRQRQRRKQ